MKDIDKAREVFDSEIFTLSQYLKDKDMRILHEKRFLKMLAAMETANRYFDFLSKEVEEIKVAKESDKALGLIFQSLHNIATNDNITKKGF